MQLNLRTAVYHVPDYVTTYYKRQAIVESLNGRFNPPHRPGVDTLIFGSTVTELEHRHRDSSSESEVEQEGRHNSHAIELVTPSVHVPPKATGRKKRIISSSVDFRTGKQASLLPQPRRANSFQGSPSHSLRHGVGIIVTSSPTTDDKAFFPCRTGDIYLELSDRSVIGASTLLARTTSSLDSEQKWALAKTTSSSNAAVMSSVPKKRHHNPSQDGIPRNDMRGVPSPRDSGYPLRVDSSQCASDSNP